MSSKFISWRSCFGICLHFSGKTTYKWLSQYLPLILHIQLSILTWKILFTSALTLSPALFYWHALAKNQQFNDTLNYLRASCSCSVNTQCCVLSHAPVLFNPRFILRDSPCNHSTDWLKTGWFIYAWNKWLFVWVI